jgi:hypothetical protein
VNQVANLVQLIGELLLQSSLILHRLLDSKCSFLGLSDKLVGFLLGLNKQKQKRGC